MIKYLLVVFLIISCKADSSVQNPHKGSLTDDFNMSRYENDEVICYFQRYDSGLQCKWK
jgi:hypothetical protein